jgi:large repetitive protein
MEGRMNTSVRCRARAVGAWALCVLTAAALAGCGGGGGGASQVTTGTGTVSSGSAQPPTINGSPATEVTSEEGYSFTPSASGPSGMALKFSVVNQPTWASFAPSTGALSGTPADSDVGTFSNIVISVSDGEKSAALPAFNIWVRHRLWISGSPPTQAAAGKLYTFTPSAAGPSDLPLSFSITGLPSWATFNTTTGTLSGTPASGNVGTYSNIVISVTDGQKTMSLPAFSIQVSGSTSAQPPTISGFPGTQVNAGLAYSFTPTASGPSGSTLTFSVANLPPWASFSTATGTLSGTPTGANVGTFSNIVISVSDGQLSASLTPFSIQVKAVAPTISGTPGTSVTVGQGYSFTPTAHGPTGTTLIFSVTNLPSWATFSTTTGNVSGTPASGNVGTFSNITISVSDGQASAALAAFSIQVKALPPPTISGTPAITVTAGKPYSFTPTASGPSGLTLTFSVSNLPSWATFSVATGTLSGTPSSGNVGAFSNIVISVSDGQASASLPAFGIQVTALPAPTISGTPATTVMAGKAYSFTPTASGPTGLTLTFSVSNLPSWATFSVATGTLSGTPTSSNVGTTSNIVISVSDGQASASLPAFSIQVTALPPPTISGTPATTVTAGSAYAFTPAASGPSGLTLTFSIANLPSWATFNTATGALSGTPSSSNVGTFSNISISVSDGQASASLPAFTITVNAQATGNVPLSWVAPTTNTNGTTLTDLSSYIINYGTSASALTDQITVSSPTTTSYTVTGLSAGTWYFSITAYASDGTQSAPSNTVSTAVN